MSAPAPAIRGARPAAPAEAWSESLRARPARPSPATRAGRKSVSTPTCGPTDMARGPGPRVVWHPANLGRTGLPPGPCFRDPAARAANMARAAVRAPTRTPGLGGSAGPHRVRRQRRSLRGDLGPELPPPRGNRALGVRPSVWPSNPAIRPHRRPRVTPGQSATCDTVSGQRAPARTAVRAAPAPARSGGRVR